MWAALLLLAGLWIRQKKEIRVTAVVLAGHWAMCMISPVHAESRYAYPILLALPVVAAVSFGTKPEQRRGRASRSLPPSKALAV